MSYILQVLSSELADRNHACYQTTLASNDGTQLKVRTLRVFTEPGSDCWCSVMYKQVEWPQLGRVSLNQYLRLVVKTLNPFLLIVKHFEPLPVSQLTQPIFGVNCL